MSVLVAFVFATNWRPTSGRSKEPIDDPVSQLAPWSFFVDSLFALVAFVFTTNWRPTSGQSKEPFSDPEKQ